MTPPLLAIHVWWRAAPFVLLICTLFCTLFFSPFAVSQPANEQATVIEAESYELAEEREAENVARLLNLITRHNEEVEELKKTQPSTEELAQRDAAQRDAENLAEIPYSPGKVRLNGSEANTALAHMTQRLSDRKIPESRRDIALICSIKTRLFGTLIASENRSLIPAGKNQYIARVRLQPGDSTLRVGDDLWEVSLPKDINAADYLITLYAPPGREPEFHIFSVTDLLAEKQPHIPAWLPAGINLDSTAG